jgi:LDH2 family malate/lactate/ureidoglycolate dehydrogenase
MLPLGSDSEHGSHKGYMLGSIVDIFSGVLSGANFGPWVPPFPAYIPLPENQPGKGIGQYFGAMRIDAFRPASDFKNDMDLWIKRFRCTEPINNSQPVVIPGDPERKSQKERLANGIPIHQAVLEDLDQLASKLNISKLFS